jgi:Cof subfamily protein (haloacid dehalogenase superfamily)
VATDDHSSEESHLYISDLDGTLLRGDGTLSEFSRGALTRLLGAGLRLSIASARSVVSIRDILGDLPIALPVIAGNGSHLSDFHTGAHHAVLALAPGVARSIHDLGAARGLVPLIASHDGRADHMRCAVIAHDGMRWYAEDREARGDARFRLVSDLGEAFAEQVTCLTFIDRRDPLEAIAREISARFDGQVMLDFYENRYQPGWFWLTVHDGRVSKGKALAVLAERECVALEDVVVFGDATNDLSMFEVAGRAIAVANAAEELRAAAHEVIESNEDDGVARYLLRRFASAG